MPTCSTLPWWYRKSAQKALESWTYPLIAPRPYSVRYEVGDGSYMNFGTHEIVVDPVASDFLGVARDLPLMWGRTRLDTEAKLQWRFARSAARHESMHVLFSVPPDCGGTLHYVVNVLEDEWIEQLARIYYPAAWADFLMDARLLAKYWPLPNLRLRSRETVLVSMCLYHRWDWKRPKGTPSRYCFHSPDDEQFWLKDIRPLVEQAWKTNEDKGRKEIAREILRRIGVSENAPVSGSGLILPPHFLDIEGSRAEEDTPTVVPVGVHTSTPEQGEDGAGSGVSMSGPSVGIGKEPPHSALVEVDDVRDDEVPDQLTSEEELYLLPPQFLMELVKGEKNRLLRTLIVPTLERLEDAAPHGPELSVEDYIRTDGARPFLLRDDDAPDHEGLAVVILIDTTGSMEGWEHEDEWDPIGGLDEKGRFRSAFYNPAHRMTYARQVAMLFELVCPRAHIPLCIGACGDDGALIHLATGEGRSFHVPSRKKRTQPVTWLRTWHTPADSEMTRCAIAGLYGKYGKERVGPSLHQAAAKLSERKEQNKLILFIHDGLPTDEEPETIRGIVDTLRRKGIIVVAPFVGEQSDIKQLQAIFGAEWTVPTPRLPDLVTRLGRILVKYARR